MRKLKTLIYWLLCLLVWIPACNSQNQIISKEAKLNKTLPQTHLSERLEKLGLSELSGQVIHLRDSIGKPIFLNFWATWCGPCRSEMATIDSISHQFKDEIIFLLASNEDTIKIQSYLSENKFDLHFIHLDISYLDAYVVELPTTFLIDRNGQLVSEEEGFRIWTDRGNVEKLSKIVKLGTRN